MEADDAEAAESAKREVGVGSRELIVLISSVMALMAVGLDLILPGFDEIRDSFGLDEDSNQVGQIITVYFFGMAVAQLVWGPLADRFGRKPILYAGVGLYVAGAAASALAPTFGFLLAARVFWGMGAAAARVVATSIVRDRFVGDEMARVLSLIMAVFVLVPIVAPSFGAVILSVFSWPAVFWFCALWAAVVALWSTRLRETLDPAHVRPFNARQIGRSYLEVARIPMCAWYTAGTTFLQMSFTLYLATSELMIGKIYDREAQFPVIFGIIAVMFGMSAVINSRFVERFGINGMLNRGLIAGAIGAAALVVVSVASGGRPSFWLFVVMTGLTLASFMLLMPNMNTAAMIPVGHIAGSASAFISAVRIGVGSAIAGVLTRFVTDSVTPFAVTLLATMVLTSATIVIVRRLETRSAVPATP